MTSVTGCVIPKEKIQFPISLILQIRDNCNDIESRLAISKAFDISMDVRTLTTQHPSLNTFTIWNDGTHCRGIQNSTYSNMTISRHDRWFGYEQQFTFIPIWINDHNGYRPLCAPKRHTICNLDLCYLTNYPKLKALILQMINCHCKTYNTIF